MRWCENYLRGRLISSHRPDRVHPRSAPSRYPRRRHGQHRNRCDHANRAGKVKGRDVEQPRPQLVRGKGAGHQTRTAANRRTRPGFGDDTALPPVRGPPHPQTTWGFGEESPHRPPGVGTTPKDRTAKYCVKAGVPSAKGTRKCRKIATDITPPATSTPPMAPIEITMAMQRTPVGQEMLELGELSPLQLITETFEHDKVRALLLYASCMWGLDPVSYTHLRAHETVLDLVCRLLLAKKNNN